MDVPCTFDDYESLSDEIFYHCLIQDEQIPEDEDFIYSGQHLNDRTNNDVTYVQFDKCTMSKIPKGLTKSFPNMQALCILTANIENISKDDLLEYKNLKRFHFENNNVEFLPGDLFDDFRNLEWISFFGNELKVIEPNLLDGLDNLKYVCLKENQKFDKFYSVYNEHESNATLEEIKDDLNEKFYEADPELIINYAKKLQASLKTGLIPDIKSLIRDENSKDFSISINNHEFKVHKFLLAARSPTLAELLRNNPEVENLNLVDIPVEIFELILKFIYTDELPRGDATDFIQLLSAAYRLKIETLVNFAAENLTKQLNEDNALNIFKISHKYQQDELREQSYREVKYHYLGIKFKDEWINDPEKVENIIQEYIKMEADIQTIRDKFYNLLDES
ncbi:hypothetical protein ACKWTF_015050 [Chironomus riparius]